jgi:hypothetical protein
VQEVLAQTVFSIVQQLVAQLVQQTAALPSFYISDVGNNAKRQLRMKLPFLCSLDGLCCMNQE